ARPPGRTRGHRRGDQVLRRAGVVVGHRAAARGGRRAHPPCLRGLRLAAAVARRPRGNRRRRRRGEERPMTVQLSTSLRSFAAEDPGNWDDLFETARCLDAAGVDRVVLSDHVVFGEDLDSYGRPELGGQAGGKQPTGPDGHWLEPMTTLAVLAGRTERVRLGTNILLAALRRP